MADLGDDVYFASIVELNKRLRAKNSARSNWRAHFATGWRNSGRGITLWLCLCGNRRCAGAAEVDGDMKRERFRGPLQGIPLWRKRSAECRRADYYVGRQTVCGAGVRLRRDGDQEAGEDGRVLTGKLSMVELAGGGGYRYASASLFGAGLNPWDRSRWSGGSSSGPGSAVAAGLVTYAIGSETSGSILTPSAFCGVTGLRPTYGLVSRFGAMALSWTMDKLGPMCRTAEDCGIVLQAIAGKDEKDPGTAGKSFYFSPQFAPRSEDDSSGILACGFRGMGGACHAPGVSCRRSMLSAALA